MSFYPLIKYPAVIKNILSEQPPLPSKPHFPSEPILQLASESPHPGVFTKPIPKKISYVGLGIGELGVTITSAIIGGFTNNSNTGITAFIFGTLVIALVGWSLYTSYPNRVRKYRQQQVEHEEKVRNYSVRHQEWEIEKVRILKEHQQEINRWQKEVDRLNAEYEQQVQASHTEEAIDSWRNQELQDRIKYLHPVQLTLEQAEDRRGYAEYPSNCKFPNLLRHYFGEDNIHIIRKMQWYIPDFAYIDSKNNIYIDIEIDEPYTPRKYPNDERHLVLTHCQEDDERRDICFTNSDWFVIRFSEKQVLLYPESCCRTIALLIYKLTGNQSILTQLARYPDLQPERQWTTKEAEEKAQRRERLNYRGQPKTWRLRG